MAEYILDVATQTSKLDWAFPFQRTGAFPLDRSVLFSTLADATAYAKGDGSDARGLGGTSYVGQIISVLEGEGVSAYLIGYDRKLVKLAATTTTGDLAADLDSLEETVGTLTETVTKLTDKVDTVEDKADANAEAITSLQNGLADVYTKVETDEKIGAAVAGAAHLKRVIVDSIDDIDVDAADALEYIYMVANGLEDDDNKYYEYIVIEVSDGDEGTVRQIEQVGNWSVDLSDYAKTADVTAALADKADSKDVYTKDEANKKIEDALKAATGGESASDVLVALNNYKASNDSRVEAVEADVDTLEEKVSNLKAVGAEKNFIASVDETELKVDAERKLSVVALPMSKVTNLVETLNDKATKEEVQTVSANLSTLQTEVEGVKSSVTNLAELLNSKASQEALETLSGRVDNIENILTWKEMEIE